MPSFQEFSSHKKWVLEAMPAVSATCCDSDPYSSRMATACREYLRPLQTGSISFYEGNLPLTIKHEVVWPVLNTPLLDINYHPVFNLHFLSFLIKKLSKTVSSIFNPCQSDFSSEYGKESAALVSLGPGAHHLAVMLCVLAPHWLQNSIQCLYPDFQKPSIGLCFC